MNDQQLYEVLLRKYKSVQNGDITWGDVAEEMLDLGVDKTANALRKWFHRRYAGESNLSSPSNMDIPLQLEDLPEGNLVDKIWESSKLDPNEWELAKFWGSLESPQASFIKRETPTADIIDAIKEKLNRDWQILTHKESEGALFVASLVDAHIGKLNNDGHKTEDYFISVLHDLLNRALMGGKISKAMLPFGNDFGHIDNVHYSTTKGTPQEVTANYMDIISLQVGIAVKSVEMLAEYFPVDVVMIPGNHDRFSNYWLGHVFEQRFEKHPNVKIDNGQNPRKYYPWGKTLIAMMHGDQERHDRIANLISTEARSLWGQTEYCEVLTGHIHTRSDTFTLANEINGVMQRKLPSLSGADTWHQFNGYVKNGRGGMGLIYSKDYGCTDVYFSSIEQFI